MQEVGGSNHLTPTEHLLVALNPQHKRSSVHQKEIYYEPEYSNIIIPKKLLKDSFYTFIHKATAKARLIFISGDYQNSFHISQINLRISRRMIY